MPPDDLTNFQNRLQVNGWRRDDVPVGFVRGDTVEQTLTRPGGSYGRRWQSLSDDDALPSKELSYAKLQYVLCPLTVGGTAGWYCEQVAADALRQLQQIMPVKYFVAPGMATMVDDHGDACTTIYACVPRAAISGYQQLWRELVGNAMPVGHPRVPVSRYWIPTEKQLGEILHLAEAQTGVADMMLVEIAVSDRYRDFIVGDVLWVKEPFATFAHGRDFGLRIRYEMDDENRIWRQAADKDDRWRPIGEPTHWRAASMPRWLSRFSLRVEWCALRRLKFNQHIWSLYLSKVPPVEVVFDEKFLDLRR